MATALLIIHGLVAVALLGAITHQALATWAPARGRPGSFLGRFRAVPSASYASAIVVLYAVSALLGGIVYLHFRVDIRPDLERAGHWQTLGLFDIKEHFVAIGLALLPAYWICWRRPRAGESHANARRVDLDPRLHRLVELSDRSRRERHPGLRLVTPSPALHRFASAYGMAFAVLYVIALKLDLALFTVYPSLGVVLPGTHHARDVVDPSLGFVVPAMYWYGWTATAALGALVVGFVAAFLPERWTRWFWPGWLWVLPALAMIACVYLTLPWFRI